VVNNIDGGMLEQIWKNIFSSRHADMLIVTEPASRQMELALKKTYIATPEPKLVVACGDCAIGSPQNLHQEHLSLHFPVNQSCSQYTIFPLSLIVKYNPTMPPRGSIITIPKNTISPWFSAMVRVYI